jgi:hypothetical protein
MLIAGRISQAMDDGEGRVTDLAPYLLNKLWGINYIAQTGPTSDAQEYIAALAGQGYSVTAANLILLHTLSFAFSGGFLGLARGTWNYVFDGPTFVKPLSLTIGGVSVFWPELTTWMNADNVSQEVSVDAQWKDSLRFRAGVDKPVVGNLGASVEVTSGVAVRLHRLTLGTEFTSGFTGYPFVKGILEIPLNDAFSIGIEGHFGTGTTMRERREYPLGSGVVGFLNLRH